MNIGSVNSVIDGLNITKPDGASTSSKTNDQQTDFMDYLLAALGNVDNLQKDAAADSIKAATGDQAFLHNAMIAYEKANIALQLTIEIRNRVVEAYQEIMRIQM